MPQHTIPGTNIPYALIAYEQDGQEHAREQLARQVVEQVRTQPITDVFLQSHGWKGDLPAAEDQYNRWFGSFVSLSADADRMRHRFPGFNPMLVGLHWPSLPFGDEELGGDGSFSIGGPAMMPGDALLEKYVERLGDTPAIRRALETIFREARDHAATLRLTPEAEEAYRELDGELDMGEDGEGAAPGDDREPFNPQEAFESGDEVASFGWGSSLLGGVLGPLRQLSFWKMKDRARLVGESGMHTLVRDLQSVRDVRIHLMGHSFGCIVASAIVRGPDGGSGLPRPIASMVLVQGALSIWSFSPQLPDATGQGYFHDVVARGRVKGPLVTTQSQHDSAVGRLYPWAAGVRSQVAFDPLAGYPKYAALGTFGVRGLGAAVDDRQMMPHTVDYKFEPGKIYNLESSRYIRFGDGVSGAHNDIDGLEVAHATWQAASSAS